MANKFDAVELEQLLPTYYKRLFPFKHYHKWLAYGRKPGEYWSLREFAFILKDDVYLRYRSFDDQSQFEKDVIQTLPFKIDIGAVFNMKPRDNRKTMSFEAKERELIFDIDLTDYDDVRTCCSGGGMCSRCWIFMVIAVKIIDLALKDDFGLQHCLWVYSGRRGVHCWVCDPIARSLTAAARGAISDYLQLVVGGDKQARKVQLPAEREVHPMISRAFDIIVGNGNEPGHSKNYFERLCVDQGWLDGPEQWTKMTSLCPDAKLQKIMEEKFVKLETPQERCEAFLRLFTPTTEKERLLVEKQRHFACEIVLQWCYPRLDINVTKGVNHLLKSPFCIHPKTGRVCVPFSAGAVDLFNVDSVPTLTELTVELNELRTEAPNKENENDRKPLDYKRTSLGDYIDHFDRFVVACCKAETQHGKKVPDDVGF